MTPPPSATSDGSRAATTRRGRPSLHRQVCEQITERLLTYPGDTESPVFTESGLAEELGVSRNTLRKAMDAMEQQGYVSRRPGAGVFLLRRPVMQLGTDSPTTRRRIAVLLPIWNDSPHGFFSHHLLESLAAPEISPRLVVEVRHHDDPLHPEELRESHAILAIDPGLHRLADLEALQQKGHPVAIIAPKHPAPAFQQFVPDSAAAVADAVEHLHHLGHRHIGLINKDPGEHQARLRLLQGFLAAHHRLKLPIQPGALIQHGAHHPAAIPPDLMHVTAWIGASLSITQSLALACEQAGQRVPDDLSLISLDDPGPAPMPGAHTAVTALIPDTAALARAVLAWLDQPGAATATPLHCPYHWIHRASVAPPPARA